MNSLGSLGFINVKPDVVFVKRNYASIIQQMSQGLIAQALKDKKLFQQLFSPLGKSKKKLRPNAKWYNNLKLPNCLQFKSQENSN